MYFDGYNVIAEIDSDDQLPSPCKGSHYHAVALLVGMTPPVLVALEGFCLLRQNSMWAFHWRFFVLTNV